MDHPTARGLRRTLLLTQVILAALVLLILVLAYAWGSLVAQLGVVALLLACYALLVVRPLGKNIGEVVGGALRRAEALQREVERLEEAHARAQADVQAKSAFLAAMSHEIRTPMNGVIGMASLLDESRLDSAQRDFVSTIRSSGDVLLTLINDVLDLSKIEAGEVKPDLRPVPLRPLVEAAFDLVASRAAGKGLDLVYAPAPGVPAQIETDPTRLRQILVNLLSNAVRHTAQGEVVVAVRPEQAGSDRLVFDVRDTGEGMSQDVLARLFRPYQQAERQQEGTGLGLHICKHLAKLLGGRIAARSAAGVGSTFTVTIAAPAVDHDEPVLSGLEGYAVAVTVPNRALREALAVRLRVWGLDVTPYATLADAEAALAEGHRYHALVLDLTADEAGASGLARLNAVQASLPVVGLAGLQQPVRDLSLAVRLTKPVKDIALHEALRSVLAPTQVVQTHATPKSATDRVSLRVLLVEDHAINQKVALRLLERMGVDADLAANGRDAVDAVQQAAYDLVLMDVQMPVMDGVAATRAIRQLDLPAQPRIVALTAEAMDGDRATFLEAGMDDYLAKPFSLEDLSAVLDEAGLVVTPTDPHPVLPRMAEPRLAEPHSGGSHSGGSHSGGSRTTDLGANQQSSAEPAEPTAALDYQALRARLAHLVGDDDPAFMRETLTSFLIGGPLLIGEIQDALYRNDRAAARKAAQTLRSSAALLGAEALTEACRALETALLAGSVTSGSPEVQAVQHAYREIQARMEGALAEEQTQARRAKPDAASARLVAMAESG
ncbi:MAG: response regulator [Bacteroidota bacterium]